MQRHYGVVQLIGIGNISTVGIYGIIQSGVLVKHSTRHHKFHSRLLQVICLIPLKNIFLRMRRHHGNLSPLSLHGKAYFGCIAQRIHQCINNLIGTFFIYIYQSATVIGGMQHAQTVARSDKRFHILSFRPRVDVPVFFISKTVDHAAEYFLSIYFQNHRMHSITILRPFHIIISTNSQANPSPSHNGFSQTLHGKCGRCLLPFYFSTARLRKHHNALCTWCCMIFYILFKKGQRIDVISG